MEINYSNEAYATLLKLINFIEDNNTQGAGIRWFRKYEEFLYDKLTYYKHIGICKNQTFRKLNLYCIEYHEWVVAFSIYNDSLCIEALLHKSRIVD